MYKQVIPKEFLSVKLKPSKAKENYTKENRLTNTGFRIALSWVVGSRGMEGRRRGIKLEDVGFTHYDKLP